MGTKLMLLALLVAGCSAVINDSPPHSQDLLIEILRGQCAGHGEVCTKYKCCGDLTCILEHWGDKHYCSCRKGWMWDQSASSCRQISRDHDAPEEVPASLIAACVSVAIFLVFAALLIVGLARTRMTQIRSRMDGLSARARQVLQRKEDSPPAYDDVATVQIPELEVPPPSYAEILQNQVSTS